MFFGNSKPLVGFDDRFLVIAGIFINTHVAVTSFYQGAIYELPFSDYYPKWLEYLFFVAFVWWTLRGILLIHRKRNPGFKGRKKRYLLLPFLVIPYAVIAILYLKFLQPLLNIQMPGYEPPALRELLITGGSIVIIDLAVYIIMIYVYELNRAKLLEERLKKENAISELKALKNQLSPHFLSNSLTTLLFLIDFDPKKSKEFALNLAAVYNKLLDFSDQDLIFIKDEIAYIYEYASLLQNRFGTNLNIHIDLPETINDKKIVPLSLQVGVENAVKHNVVSKAKPLKISITKNHNHILVKNNFQPKGSVPDRHGIGISNLKKRYQLVTKKELLIDRNEDSFILKIPIIEAQ